MDAPSTSAEATTTTTTESDVLCQTITNLKETYSLGPGADGIFYVVESQEEIPDIRHIAYHKLQYSLLEECVVFVHLLRNLGKSLQADYLMATLIMQYYDVFQHSPLEYKCQEAHCKIYVINTLQIIQIMKRSMYLTHD